MKLKLDIDTLAVDTFQLSTEDASPRGTVRGFDSTLSRCTDWDTCASCGGTCDWRCNDTLQP